MLQILGDRDPDNIFPYQVYSFDFTDFNQIVIASENGVFRSSSSYNYINFKNINIKMCNDIVKHVAIGKKHVILLKENGSILGVGDNSNCQLNINNMYERDPVQIQLPAPAIHVACGFDTSVVVFKNGYCKFGDTLQPIMPTIIPFPKKEKKYKIQDAKRLVPYIIIYFHIIIYLHILCKLSAVFKINKNKITSIPKVNAQKLYLDDNPITSILSKISNFFEYCNTLYINI